MKIIGLSREKSNTASGAVGGAFSLTVSTLIVKLLGVIYKIPLARFLGEEGMGYFNSAYTVYAFFYLICTAGVPKAVMILVSEARERGGQLREEAILRVAMRAFLLLGAFSAAALILLAGPLSDLIGNSGACATMVAIAPSMLFVSLAGVIRGYLSAKMSFLSIAVSQILEGVGKLVIGLMLAMWGIGRGLPLPTVSALTILGVSFGAVFGLVYLLVCAKIRIFGKKTGQNLDSKEIVRKIFSISVPITVSSAVMSITSIIDLSLIMRRLEALGYTQLEATSLYGNYTTLAVPMFNLALSVITPVSIAFLPIFTRLWVRQSREELSASLGDSLKLSYFLSAPLMIGMTVYSSEILTLLYGDVGINVGAPLLCLLSPGIFFMSSLLIINSALEAVGKVKAPVISMLVGSVFKVICSGVLLSNPDFGISGAPIGTVISYVFALIVSLWIAVGGARLRVPIISSAILPHLCAVIAILPTVSLHRCLLTLVNPTVALFIVIAVAAVMYIVLSMLSGVLGAEKLKNMAKYTKEA